MDTMDVERRVQRRHRRRGSPHAPDPSGRPAHGAMLRTGARAEVSEQESADQGKKLPFRPAVQRKGLPEPGVPKTRIQKGEGVDDLADAAHGRCSCAMVRDTSACRDSLPTVATAKSGREALYQPADAAGTARRRGGRGGRTIACDADVSQATSPSTVSSAVSAASPHSQTTAVRQPSACSADSARLSRAIVAVNLAVQNSARVEGVLQ